MKSSRRLQVGDEPGIDISQTTDSLKEDMGQPMLIALNQMNTFMGQLIAETQKTHKLLEGITAKEVEEVDQELELEEDVVEPKEEGSDDEELLDDDKGSNEDDEELLDDEEEEKSLELAKTLDIIGSYSEKLNKSLSRFNL